MQPLIEAGQTPAEAVATCAFFPEPFVHLYTTGEMTGQLDQSLKRLAAMFQEEASRKLRAFSQWLPKVVYFLVVLMIAWRIIAFWTDYFGQINKAINF
jgi:type II secretory pathway component PulF